MSRKDITRNKVRVKDNATSKVDLSTKGEFPLMLKLAIMWIGALVFVAAFARLGASILSV